LRKENIKKKAEKVGTAFRRQKTDEF